MLKKVRNYGILFFLGATLAPIGDIAHVITKTTSYPVEHQHIFNLIPYWVPIQFGIMTVLIGLIYNDSCPNRLKNFNFLECTLSALSLIACYCLSGFLPLQPWLSFIVISIACLANYYVLSDSVLTPKTTIVDSEEWLKNPDKYLNSLPIAIKREGRITLTLSHLHDDQLDLNLKIINNLKIIVLSIFISVIGTLAEFWLVKAGIFTYQIIPYWLPLLYVHASLTVGAFACYLSRI